MQDWRYWRRGVRRTILLSYCRHRRISKVIPSAPTFTPTDCTAWGERWRTNADYVHSKLYSIAMPSFAIRKGTTRRVFIIGPLANERRLGTPSTKSICERAPPGGDDRPRWDRVAGVERPRQSCHIRGMRPYIGIASEPGGSTVKFVQERQFIVLAESREAAEAAFRAHLAKTHPDWVVFVSNDPPPPGYVEAANLSPGVVMPFNP
jgi:hypothetical protein